MKIHYVPIAQIDVIWDSIKDEIQRALDHAHGEEEIQDVYQKLQDGTRGLLTIVEDGELKAVITVEFIDYPQLRALRVVTISGYDYGLWQKSLDDMLIKWAKEQGMDRIEAMVRKGQIRSLAPLDYKPAYTFMTKDIDNG